MLVNSGTCTRHSNDVCLYILFIHFVYTFCLYILFIHFYLYTLFIHFVLYSLFIHFSLGSAGESDPVFPMTAEANDEKTVARISIDTLGAEGVKKLDETTQEEPGAVGKDPVDDTRISVVKISREESSEREGIRLGNVPTTAVERSLYNNYKFLLQIMSQRLLSNDLIKLKEWAEGTFSIDANSRDAIEIFRKLDQQEVISASNLVLLREFFEKILRIDLAHLIDCFMRGDYSLLRNTNSSFPRNGPGIPNGRFASRSPQGGTGTLNPRREPSPTLDSMNTGFSKAVEVNETATRVNYHSPVPACRGENPSISQRNVREVAVADCQVYNSNGKSIVYIYTLQLITPISGPDAC